MKQYKNIQNKLAVFYKKYYTNELIKGTILFCSIGLIYFLFTLYVEYFLWLKPSSRAILFLVFILAEGYLFYRFILTPIIHLVKIKKGISEKQSSEIIGNHFPEVRDKLLNLLQLKRENKETELLLASIEQKSIELQPIQFTKAINFKKSLKHAKYLLIPIFVWLISFFSGTSIDLSKSFSRVVNYQKEYIPPAPFEFSLKTNELRVIEGKSFQLEVVTKGSVVPREAKVFYNKQEYYLQEKSSGRFFFNFNNVLEPIDFYLEANGVRSKTFRLQTIKTPTIQNISINLDYPNYTKKKNEIIDNTGNLIVPEGTEIKWEAITRQTNQVDFIEKNERTGFFKVESNKFSYQKKSNNNITYQIASSNNELKDFEKLVYNIKVVKDEFPTILVQSNIDSLTKGEAQFAGQISDDYGISKLELVYYNQDMPRKTSTQKISINNQNIQTFFYQFPDQIQLEEGVNYELFFQVLDNDEVNGRKKAISKRFSYRKKTEEEIKEETLQNQRKAIQNLEETIQNQKNQEKVLDQIQKDIQSKKEIKWNDKKKIDEFIQRQEQYKQMMERQTDDLQETLDEKKEETPTLENKKEELKKRIEELQKLNKQNKLLKELQKMADKLDKEELVRKVKKLTQQNKQKERSLERILELTKRFYVEEKTMQLANKLDKTSKKQENIDNEKEEALEKQKEVRKEFNKISKELDELQKDNKKLKEPMEIPEMENEKKETKDELNKSEEKIQQNQKNQAKQSQKKASKKMKQMSQQMQQAMVDMQANSIDENIDDLRKILENLVTFSFKQEELMDKFDEISVRHPDFGKNLKKQNQIKTYFEHIDDSLYVLSMRLPQLTTKIQEDLSNTHYNLGQSLENFAENRFGRGVSNQQYVMTSANNLSDFLSDLLNNMQNSMKSSGKGNSSSKSFSLPTLIQKQKGLSEKMKEGLQKGEKGKEKQNGKQGRSSKEGNGNSEDMNGELFKIYQQQNRLREQLKYAIKQGGKEAENGKKALKTMEQLESEILEKGFNEGTLQRMKQLEYELLKLDKAAFEQGKDKKRKSYTNNIRYQKKIKELRFKKRFYNEIEILNRQSLPLHKSFEKKVQKYFSKKEMK